jgi:hypothetical protein
VPRHRHLRLCHTRQQRRRSTRSDGAHRTAATCAAAEHDADEQQSRQALHAAATRGWRGRLQRHSHRRWIRLWQRWSAAGRR